MFCMGQLLLLLANVHADVIIEKLVQLIMSRNMAVRGLAEAIYLLS